MRRSTIDAWRCLFDDEEHLESRAFPPLHKIVLGLSSVDLQMQLSLSTAGIDDKDADGRTALSWAATRGDLRSVTLLLRHRADPDMPSMRGQTPLHWASQNSSQEGPEILQALVDAGSNVDQVDYWKRTALIYASCNQDDPRCLEILVNGGANLNSQDCHQRTPLGYAATMGKSKGLGYLLSAGADTGRVNVFGFPPLFEALQNNHPECVRILLQHDPASVFLDISGMSALHVAALYSNPETLDTLVEYGSEQFATRAMNATGTTPQDLFDQREDITAEHREAFERLTRKARACVMTESAPELPQEEHEHRDEEAAHEEEFVDALENLDITDGPGGT